jgi:hypothetical protein
MYQVFEKRDIAINCLKFLPLKETADLATLNRQTSELIAAAIRKEEDDENEKIYISPSLEKAVTRKKHNEPIDQGYDEYFIGATSWRMEVYCERSKRSLYSAKGPLYITNIDSYTIDEYHTEKAELWHVGDYVEESILFTLQDTFIPSEVGHYANWDFEWRFKVFMTYRGQDVLVVDSTCSNLIQVYEEEDGR